MREKIANWLIAKAMKTPYFHLEGYMERFWLVPYVKGGSETAIGCGKVSWFKRPIARLLQCFGIAIRIHHILRSDDDRAFHDHPWPFVTVILKGGYVEVTPKFDKSGIYIGEKRKFHGPGTVLFRRSTSWHRLEIFDGADCWTMFWSGKYQQTWGFLITPAFKMKYGDFLRLDDKS